MTTPSRCRCWLPFAVFPEPAIPGVSPLSWQLPPALLSWSDPATGVVLDLNVAVDGRCPRPFSAARSHRAGVVLDLQVATNGERCWCSRVRRRCRRAHQRRCPGPARCRHDAPQRSFTVEASPIAGECRSFLEPAGFPWILSTEDIDSGGAIGLQVALDDRIVVDQASLRSAPGRCR